MTISQTNLLMYFSKYVPMIQKLIISIFLGGLLVTSCKNKSNNPAQEIKLELKQKELELKKNELAPKRDSIKPTKSSALKGNKRVAKPDFNQNLLLGGCWFIPHSADINIRFYRDFTFKFNDYDIKRNTEVLLTGTYSLDGNDLWLNYSDESKQKFYFYKAGSPDANYYIKGLPLKTNTYYFVHGECE